MTFVTLTPNATTASTGALTGSSVHAALSDASDSTYVTYDNGEYSTVSFSDLSLPAGAQLVSAQLKFRCAKSGTGTPAIYGEMYADDTTSNATSVTWGSPQEVGSAFQFGGLTDAGLDGVDAYWLCASSGAQVTVYEASVSVLYLTKPTATVSAPSGTISTNLATVTWSGSYDVHTTSAPAYSDVKVFSSAQYSAGGFNPSTSTAVCSSGVEYGSSLSRAFSERLPDGNYRAYVRVAPGNASSLWSDWDYEAFTVSASLPDEPTIELSGENSRGRVRIDVECGADTDSVQVQRDSGDGFVNVRTADGDGMVALSDAGTVFDYEAPNGVSCDYRVRAYDESNATFSDWVEGTASWSSDDAWLKCVGDPSLNLSLTARSYEGFEVPANQGVFRVLGSSEATVVQDTPGPMSGRVVFMTRSEDDRVALGSLLGSGSPVLLQVNGHPDRLVSLGDRSSTRLADHGWVEEHDDALVWTVVGEDDRVVGLGFWPYVDVVPLSRLALFLPLGASAGLTDLSGNGRDGTAGGGVTVGGVSEGPLALGDEGATDFDGTDDRITTTYETRRNHFINPSFEVDTTGVGIAGVARTNLCVNPSFETNTTAWAAVSASAAQSADSSMDGSNSLKATASGANAYVYYNQTVARGGVTAGTSYSWSAHFRRSTTGRQMRVGIGWYDSGNNWISSSTGTTNSTYTANTWTRLSVTGTAPTGAVSAVCYVYFDVGSAGSAGEIIYVDAALLEASSVTNFYFPTEADLLNGSAEWTGTPHGSTSTLSPYWDRVTPSLVGGSYALRVTSNGINSGASFVSSGSSLSPSKTYTGSIYVKARPGSEGRTLHLSLTERTSAPATVGTTTAEIVLDGTLQRISVTRTFGATGVDFWLYPTCPDVGYRAQFDVDGVMLEETATVGTYFPTATQLANGQAGWLGTAHASKSDFGCFANGTVRTFMGWFHRDALGSSDVLFGGTTDPTGGVIRINSADFLIVTDGSSSASMSPAITTVGEWMHVAVVVDEPNDLVTCYINGEFYDDAAMSFQYPQAGSLSIGATGAAANPFDGKQAWVSVHERALTADEIQATYNAGIGTATLGPYLT